MSVSWSQRQVGDSARRQDMLDVSESSHCRASRKIFPDLPPRLLIVSAGDPMWRGGLSGPRRCSCIRTAR
jgi:hypothetical protein